MAPRAQLSCCAHATLPDSGYAFRLDANVPGAFTYTMPAEFLRGGFRYLTVFLSSSGWVDLSRVSLDQ
jgi:hypothetical protein